jgi:acyl-CoA synthetase (AMP-forming)/AMP-acid ligase II
MRDAETLLGALARAAALGEGVRFLERGREELVSYREVQERAAAVAGGLAALGVGAGDRIGVAIPTSPDFYDAFFGVLASGALPLSLPLPPRFGSRRDVAAAIASTVRSGRLRLVVTDASQFRRFEAHGAVTVDELRGSTSSLWIDRGPDALALVQLSSGTTGAPKAIGLTHRQILSNVHAILDAIFDAYPPEEGYRHGGVSWLPLYHDMGLVGSLLTALVRPGPLTLMRPEEFVARPSRWLEAISRYRATISAAPHFAYAFACDRIREEELEGVDLSSWLLALDGAEAVTPETLERFYERFRGCGLRKEALTPVYGLAEATLAVTFSDPRSTFRWKSFDREALVEEARARLLPGGLALTSCGSPLPGLEIRIADEDGNPLAETRVGRVLIQGPSVTSGYLDRDSDDELLHQGFLDTGDRGFRLDGELYLCGRTKDLIILRGRNYAPEHIEQAVEGVAGTRPGGSAAVGILTGQGEGLALLVERGGVPADPAEEALLAALRARIAERCGVVPDRLVLLEPGALPRTSSGKIRRREAARLFAGEEALL